MAMSLAQAMVAVGEHIPLADPKVEGRLNRAYDIVRCNGSGYAITPMGKGVYTVFKASTSGMTDNSITYVVDKVKCTCVDYPSARANLCKHRLAIKLYELVHGIGNTAKETV
jgi:hypothetical protein